MPHSIRFFFQKHKLYWSHVPFLRSTCEGILLLVFGLFVTYLASAYATIRASNAVGDLILDYLKPRDVTFIFIEVSIVFVLFIIALMVYEPRWLPFCLKAMALFYLVRSFFIILTHLGPIPERTIIDVQNFLIKKLIFGGDYFFSGHTGTPFLFALIFWQKKCLRYLFLIASLVGGAAVLVGHLHYSIDVFAAFFITYGIFQIAQKAFAKDYEFFLKSLFHKPSALP